MPQAVRHPSRFGAFWCRTVWSRAISTATGSSISPQPITSGSLEASSSRSAKATARSTRHRRRRSSPAAPRRGRFQQGHSRRIRLRVEADVRRLRDRDARVVARRGERLDESRPHDSRGCARCLSAARVDLRHAVERGVAFQRRPARGGTSINASGAMKRVIFVHFFIWLFGHLDCSIEKSQ